MAAVPLASPLHATSVMISGRVLLLTGGSGCGKSDLALRLIDRGALLVSDDYTDLSTRDGVLYASPPARIAGQMEVRGIGIVDMAFAGEGPVALILDLDRAPDRMPDTPLPMTPLCGVDIPVIAFAALEASSAIKAEQALLRHGLGGTT
ncbi:aldolase [Sphingomonas sp. Root710]|uniref:HPr kinase/phosphorylase n=1 Tax=Sphingomonas sp. Root710 TaxID=1736594 RepID=UPI0006FF7E37|nr:HPr kinase/phosphatase C-terminal domain-containing protein [Sphingomonas sp. Root710]KRB85993.1 aldolase [Sphingomonas sp. Root710]